MVIAGAIFVILWLACGVISAAYTYNYFQVSYPSTAKDEEETDFKFALTWIWLGPIMLLIDWKMGFLSKGFASQRYKHDN